jgi:Flp pilus assembly protein TadB
VAAQVFSPASDIQTMRSETIAPDPAADPKLGRYRRARRSVFGVLIGVWVVVIVLIVIVPGLGAAAVALALGLGNTAYSLLLLRHLRVAHLRRAAGERQPNPEAVV